MGYHYLKLISFYRSTQSQSSSFHFMSFDRMSKPGETMLITPIEMCLRDLLSESSQTVFDLHCKEFYMKKHHIHSFEEFSRKARYATGKDKSELFDFFNKAMQNALIKAAIATGQSTYDYN
ncbi:unnamed protein product [Didymodactylos carnosus]|uniref:Uncharacterized protein n=1 Tax=Didymodactylos carnosus TaxID=1234261 RepID=A0A814GGY8_9BILA|nr:unnamed protein product [Didymodactylos carnosus]CAF0996208.1 unnamed protein product [Didymodactylos carnosus]CAF3723337.1 unnamed protein product [Didymodactylos carnosus]CAF3767828.1 unnamed protein product [Didymodactylos carnosus]